MIRDLAAADIAALYDLEGRATILLAAHGFPRLADETGPPVAVFADYLRGNRTWVAEIGGVPAGYAAAGRVGDAWYLKQLSVDPAMGRRGIGTALLDRVVAEAKAQSLRHVALSTFRDVPFNAPFYARRGFAELALEAAPAALRERFATECPPGVDPATRTLMLLDLG